MLAEGKISVDEASRLLLLINEESGSQGERTPAGKEPKASMKYLYVKVEPKPGSHWQNGKEGRHSWGEHGRVNIRIPMGLIRAGIKLKALIPPQAVDNINQAFKEKGINFDFRDLKDEYLETLVTALGESEISVDSEEAEVHIHAE